MTLGPEWHVLWQVLWQVTVLNPSIECWEGSKKGQMLRVETPPPSDYKNLCIILPSHATRDCHAATAPPLSPQGEMSRAGFCGRRSMPPTGAGGASGPALSVRARGGSWLCSDQNQLSRDGVGLACRNDSRRVKEMCSPAFPTQPNCLAARWLGHTEGASVCCSRAFTPNTT